MMVAGRCGERSDGGSRAKPLPTPAALKLRWCVRRAEGDIIRLKPGVFNSYGLLPLQANPLKNVRKSSDAAPLARPTATAELLVRLFILHEHTCGALITAI